MLEEAIDKFKVNVRNLMPDIFDNFYLKDREMCNGYAILTYELPKPTPIEEVLDIMEDDGYMRVLYQTRPNPKNVQTLFGQRACTYFMPEEQRHIKMNFSTDEKGMVNTILVTIYSSIEVMHSDLLVDLRLNTQGSMIVKSSMDIAELLVDFCTDS